MKLTPIGKLLLFLVGLALAATAAYRLLPADLLARLTSGRLAPGRSPSTAAVPTQSFSTASSSTTIRLRLEGSNTIGRDLAPALAEKFLVHEGATSIRRLQGGPDEVTVEGLLPGESLPVAIEIRAHGSGTAFDGLAKRTADIGMSSRRIDAEEKRQLAALGDMTSPANEFVLGLDGVAVVVHRANPLDAVTVEQLCDLFSGRIADWSALGGPPGPVRLHARDDRSGTWETFRALVLRDAALSPGAVRTEDSRALAAAVAADPAAIGFVGLPYIGETRALKIAESGSVAYRPTVFTVRTEDYLLSRRLYLYTATVPSAPWAGRFVTFALSHEGQRVVDAIGFVGQSLLDAPVAREQASGGRIPADYLTQTRGALRLPLAFRFESGREQLDNKAQRDLGRLLEALARPEHAGRELLLIGFADAQGTDETNLRLSRARAAAVAEELAAEGIRAVLVSGFGSALPIASNATEEGRARNRRVEVWLR